MSNLNSKRRRPQLERGPPLVTLTMGKTTLTAALDFVYATSMGNGATRSAFDQIDNASLRACAGIPLRRLTLEFTIPNRHYAHVDARATLDIVKKT